MALAGVRTQVCLSVAILTKQGKILLARQFVEMTRMKVENHLATFPKLIGTERQHNTVETAEVRTGSRARLGSNARAALTALRSRECRFGTYTSQSSR